MKHSIAVRISWLFSAVAIALSLTFVWAADSKKPVASKNASRTASKPAGAKVKPSSPVASQPGMVVQRDASGGLVSGQAPDNALLTTGDPQPVIVTQTQLPNGLIMATGSEPFLTTMTVTKATDGSLTFQCNDGAHPKGPHSHGPAPSSAKGGAR
jgi:hypothetical protein